MINASLFDEVTSGIKWQTSFHKQIAVICLCRNSRVKTKEQVVKNAEVINSVHKGTTTCITIDDLLKRGCDFAKGD